MSRLSKNIVYNLTGQMILLVLSFVAIKCIFRQLGEDALGVIYFTAVMNSVLCAVLEMGICSSTVREVSAHNKSEPLYIKDLIRTFSLFYWGAYILFGLAVYFLTPFLVEKWINLRTMDVATAIYTLRILGISSLLALPKSFYSSLFRGLQRMEFNNLIDVLSTGLQQLGVVFILMLRGNLFHVVYWFAACYCFGVLCSIIVSGHLFSVKALIPGFSINVIKRNWNFASRMAFVSATSAIHNQVDKIVISKLLSVGVTGFYTIAYNTVFKVILLADSISLAAYPSFSDLFRSGDRAGMMSQYRKLQDLLCFGFVPILAAIPFALLPLFSYMLNVEAAKLLLLPTALLCVGFYMYITLCIPGAFFFAVGKAGIAARQTLYDLFVTLPATILLIYYLGLVGAGISLIFLYSFRYIYCVPRICSECLEIPTRKWYMHVLRILVLTGLTYGVVWVILWFFSPRTGLYLFLAYFVASIIFLIGSYFMICNELKEYLYRQIKSLGGMFAKEVLL